MYKFTFLRSFHINATADHTVEEEIINCRRRKSCAEELHFHFAKLWYMFFFLIFDFVIKLTQIHKKSHTNWDNSQFDIEKGRA